MERNEDSTDDVIIEQDGANPEEESQDTSGDVNAELVTDSKKEPDDYWKNKAHEFSRKAELYEQIRPEFDELKQLIKSGQQHKQENQYSESQLRAALSSGDLTPEQRSFAESELNKIQEQKFTERENRLRDEILKAQKAEATRQQAEQQLISDPRFKDAFVTSPDGKVYWKQDSQLAQMIGTYMQDPALKERPDGSLIAAKLAYADLMSVNGQKETSKLKRQNEQLKNQTMVEGGGKNYNKPKVDPYQESLNRLKSGDKYAGKSAVKEYLRSKGAFNR